MTHISVYVNDQSGPFSQIRSHLVTKETLYLTSQECLVRIFLYNLKCRAISSNNIILTNKVTSCGLNLYSELLARILICILTLLSRIQIWVLNSIKGFTQPLFIFSYRSNYSWSCTRIWQIMYRTLYKRQYIRHPSKKLEL